MTKKYLTEKDLVAVPFDKGILGFYVMKQPLKTRQHPWIMEHYRECSIVFHAWIGTIQEGGEASFKRQRSHRQRRRKDQQCVG